MINTVIQTFVLLIFRDGLSETGVFLAIAVMIERIRFEKKVDVFRTVKDLRDYRPRMINDFVSLLLVFEVSILCSLKTKYFDI